MKEWLLVLKAADAAARWHVHHRRKGPAEEPYINHLIEVAMLVADATGGTDTNLVIAALLHDAIEDSEVPRELIAETFGEDVASLVAEVTDDKSLPKAERKLEQIKTAAMKSRRVGVEADVFTQDKSAEIKKGRSITLPRKPRTKWVGRSNIGRFLPSTTKSVHSRQTGAIQQVNLAVSQAE